MTPALRFTRMMYDAPLGVRATMFFSFMTRAIRLKTLLREGLSLVVVSREGEDGATMMIK